jgi:hypothetical protein
MRPRPVARCARAPEHAAELRAPHRTRSGAPRADVARSTLQSPTASRATLDAVADASLRRDSSLAITWFGRARTSEPSASVVVLATTVVEPRRVAALMAATSRTSRSCSPARAQSRTLRAARTHAVPRVLAAHRRDADRHGRTWPPSCSGGRIRQRAGDRVEASFVARG